MGRPQMYTRAAPAGSMLGLCMRTGALSHCIAWRNAWRRCGAVPTHAPAREVERPSVPCNNRPCDAARAKYVLRHTVRTHLGCEDAAFQCMGAGEDSLGLPGVFLKKSVLEVAGRGLADNLARLQPLLTPLWLQVRPAFPKPWLCMPGRGAAPVLLEAG